LHFSAAFAKSSKLNNNFLFSFKLNLERAKKVWKYNGECLKEIILHSAHTACLLWVEGKWNRECEKKWIDKSRESEKILIAMENFYHITRLLFYCLSRDVSSGVDLMMQEFMHGEINSRQLWNWKWKIIRTLKWPLGGKIWISKKINWIVDLSA
jgi:hypothetical protein